MQNKMWPIIVAVVLSCAPYSIAQQLIRCSEQTELDQISNTVEELNAKVLFHYLTNYQFYDFDEENEFQKEKQQNTINEETKSIRNNWKTKYKLKISNYTCIWIDPADAAWLTLGEYDFARNVFPVPLKPFVPVSINASATKVQEYLKNRVPKTAGCNDYPYLFLKTDNSQNKKLFIPFPNSDSAEAFKELVRERLIRFEIIIEIIGDATSKVDIQETESFKAYRQKTWDEYNEAKKHPRTYWDSNNQPTRVHPFSKLTKQQIEKEIVNRYVDIYSGAETHFATYDLNIPCKIYGIQIFSDQGKLFEWVQK